MNVGVDDRHCIWFDNDHDYMRVGFSEIVLDREPRACPRCRRRKSRMTELQLTGRLHPAHKRFDCGPILQQQCIDVRAREHLFRMGCSETIEVLMQVHDQTMQTVAIAVAKPRQSGDLREFDVIGRSERC